MGPKNYLWTPLTVDTNKNFGGQIEDILLAPKHGIIAKHGLPNILLLDINLNKSIVWLKFFLIFYMFAKFHGNLISITIFFIKCLNLNNFLYLKLWIKYEFLDQIVNNIWLT